MQQVKNKSLSERSYKVSSEPIALSFFFFYSHEPKNAVFTFPSEFVVWDLEMCRNTSEAKHIRADGSILTKGLSPSLVWKESRLDGQVGMAPHGDK